MLTQDQIIPFLLERCPEFASAWKEHQNGINADIGPYIDVASFVRFLVNSYEQGKLELMPQAFKAVEDMFIEGDKTVQELAALGILETLQCSASWKPFGKKAFIPFLGPKSLAAWNELEIIWRGKSSLMDVIRAENESNNG
jgi:hypothetical protein